MPEHMVIAPGEPMDRSWVKHTSHQIVWAEPVDPSPIWTDNPDPFMASPVLRRASFHRYSHPGWRVVLGFWVDDRLGVANPLIPPGYVMPGWVHRVELESRPWGIWRHDAHAHCWELVNGHDRPIGVSCEALGTYPDAVRQYLASREIRPLPPEAAHGCPPRPDVPWTPFIPEELRRLLDGDA